MKKTVSTILVPTDYSACSIEAIRWAASLAEPLAAQLILLHVISEQRAREQLAVPAMNRQEMLHREELALQELLESALAGVDFFSLKCSYMADVGDPAEKIVTMALLKGADKIVIPTYGQRDPDPETVGSVTEQVIRTSPCPVLTMQAACCEG